MRSCLYRLLILAVFALIIRTGFGQDTGDVRADLERMAKAYSHFSRTVIIHNWDLRQASWSGDEALIRSAATQRQLADELAALSEQRDALVALLKHHDPKVRTLALGALFLRLDGRDLPLFYSLAADTAETFPDLHDSAASGGRIPRAHLESRQSVALVAQDVLSVYFRAAGRPVIVRRDTPSSGNLTACQMVYERYWPPRRQRAHCASWFRAKLEHVTRGYDRVGAKERPKCEQIGREILALPLEERAWTLLYLWNFDSLAKQTGLTQDTIVKTLKEFGPEPMLRFLQLDPKISAPDLRFAGADWNGAGHQFSLLAFFILRHGRELLRPQDAAAVLACAEQELLRSASKFIWYDTAVLLQHLRDPKSVEDFVRSAMVRFSSANGWSRQGTLMGSWWKAQGATVRDRLVDWAYTEPPAKTRVFLRQVDRARRADTPLLINALVCDPRFERTEWEILKELIAIASHDLAEPLVSEKEIRSLDLSFQARNTIRNLVKLPESVHVLPDWRNRLRRHCQLPEQPAPKAPVAASILNQPLRHVSFADKRLSGGSEHDDRPEQMCFSRDGRWLAIHQSRRVEIRRAADLKRVGVIRSIVPSPVAVGFFDEADVVTVLDASNGFLKWKLPSLKRLPERHTPFEDWTARKFWMYSFDRSGDRVAHMTRDGLGCYDVKARKHLWKQPVEGEFVYGVGRSILPRVSLSPNGQRLAVGWNFGREVRVLEADTGRKLRSFDEFAGRAQSMAFAPDSKTLAFATEESGVWVFNAETGELRWRAAYPVVNGAGALLFSPKGRSLAVVANSEAGAPATVARIGVFDVDSGDLRVQFNENRVASGEGIRIALVFSLDGEQLLTAAGKRLAVWPVH